MSETINYSQMTNCFKIVAYTLLWISEKTKLTYNEVNILLYYLIIPLSWTILLDMILQMPITTPVLLLLWIGIFVTKRKSFRQWCDRVFRLSQQFIRFFGDYVKNSVIICVVVPIIVYITLLALL